MAFTAWAGSTAYSVGDIRRATTLLPTGLVFKCTVAGTSGSSEPAWPTDVNGTTTDGGVTWTGVSALFDDLSSLAPDTIIELFELRPTAALHGTTDITRWHCGVATDGISNIVWNGNTYIRMPVIADGFDFTSAGSLPRPTLSVANSFPIFASSVSALLIDVNKTTAGNDLGGAEVRRIRTLKKYLDGESAADPSATWPEERWYIDRKASENRDLIVFELASKFDLAGMFIPKRQLVANICQWEYRSSECTYTGANYFDINDNSVSALASDRCGKRLTSCNKRFANFESTGSVTVGSNQLTVVNSPETVEVNNVIIGFGVPSSTTVASKSGSVITMSANATATTTATVNGVLQNSNLAQIVVASATGLATGMTVTGTAIKADTTISGISGTTVTMNQIAEISDLMSPTTSFSATRQEDNLNVLEAASGVSVSVGQIVTGPGIVPTSTAKVTNVSTADSKKLITLDYNVTNTSTSTYSFYTLGTQPSVSYTFKGSDSYKVNKPGDGVLPFGSFPNAGRLR